MIIAARYDLDTNIHFFKLTSGDRVGLETYQPSFIYPINN
jgi:hypothetical protein